MGNTTTSPTEAEAERNELCSEVMQRIAASWKPPLTLKALRAKRPAVNDKLEAAEKKLNDTWLACRNDLADLNEFKAALDAWEIMNYKAAAALKAVR